MKARIEVIRKYQALFQLHRQDDAVAGLEAGTVYVKDQGEEWPRAVEMARASVRDGHGGSSYVASEDYVLMTQEEWPDAPFLKDKNVVLALSTPDRDEHCYLTTRTDTPDGFASLASFLMMEAHLIGEACAKAALKNLGDWDSFEFSSPAEPQQEEVAGAVVRGAANPMSFLNKGDNKIEVKDALSYSERIKLIKNLPRISKALRKERNIDARKEFAKTWVSLTDREKGHLCFELLKRATQSTVTEIVGRTIDREDIGVRSRYSVVIQKHELGQKYTSDFSDNYEMFTYLVDETGQKTPVAFKSPVNHVLYTISLLSRYHTPKDTPSVDLLKNFELFSSIYLSMFDTTTDKVENDYDMLFKHFTKSNSTHAGSLNDKYEEIEDRLVDIFSTLDEDPSPYFVKESVPLAISGRKIILPDEIARLKIIA